MTILSISAKILLSLFVVIVVLLYFLQSKLLFSPTKLSQDFVFKFLVPHEEKFISYHDKVLHGLLFKVSKPKARIIYFHGKTGALDSWGDVGANLSHQLNCDILVWDYPGYGKSTGALPTSEKELYASAEVVFAEFMATTDQNLPVIVYGRSLGSAVASYVAAKNTVQALILETPYTSIKAMAGLRFPLVPALLVRYDLDNAKNIHGLKIPILIVHGTSDIVVPYSQGKQLVAENPNIEFMTIDGGNHNDLATYPMYWEAVEKFVAKMSLLGNKSL